jgi:hypothetical protein
LLPFWSRSRSGERSVREISVPGTLALVRIRRNRIAPVSVSTPVRGTSLSGGSVPGTSYRSGEGHRRRITPCRISNPVQGTSLSGVSLLRPIDPRGVRPSGNCFLSNRNPGEGNNRFGTTLRPGILFLREL